MRARLMAGASGLVLAGLVLAGLVQAGPAAADLTGPAETPPADYGGQQYVDSKGCLFLRTGPKGREVWTPRVTRNGEPICDHPPSGRRVPVADEDGG